MRKDSELKIQSHDNPNKTKVRYVFVFDKMLLICKQTRGDHYSFKEGLKIQDYKVQDVTSRRLSRDARWAHSFMLVHKENLHAYTLLARTEDEKNKWIEAIKEAYDNEVPAQSLTSTHEPVMVTLDKPTSCQYCHKLLKGLRVEGFEEQYSINFSSKWQDQYFPPVRQHGRASVIRVHPHAGNQLVVHETFLHAVLLEVVE